MKAVRFHAHGGPEVLRHEEVGPLAAGPGQLRVRVRAAGVNFIDTYHRTGLYPVKLPHVPGLEGAGEVLEVGPGVEGVQAGDLVAWTNAPGSYAEEVLLAAERAVPIPPGLDARQAAAAMLQGMTAHYLTRSTFALGPQHTCLVHAAAGGVGLLLVQMARAAGARVFGTVSNEVKADLAHGAGAHEVILYTREDFQGAVRRLTSGRGVDVVYDGVGATTFEKSLESLARRGMLVLFGQSSGPVPPFNPGLLAQKGSLFLTRPTLFDYTAERAELEWRAREVLSAVAGGSLKLRIEREYALAEAADAHRALESRKTTGKVLLLP